MTDASGDPGPDLLPARMLNEYAYCPRLFYLEWVQGEFAHSGDTLQGKRVHRRVDKEIGKVPEADEATDRIHARSVTLSGRGIIAKIDLIEGDASMVSPVDYKKGTAPDIPEGAYEPERVQVCAQALVLRENGYGCNEGVIYFAGSKKRVKVPIDEPIIKRTMELLKEARKAAENSMIPPPLDDSPKCPRCSLVGICLPDEVGALGSKKGLGDVRRLHPARDDALPVYVQEQGMTVAKKGDVLEVRRWKEVKSRSRLMETSLLAIFGNVQVTTQALHELCKRGIPICYFSYGGWFYGITTGMSHKNVELRKRQFEIAGDPVKALSIASRLVSGKIKNCRTLLRRNNADTSKAALNEMARLGRAAPEADSLDTLLGIEGAASRVYFSQFEGMLKQDVSSFDFNERNRRPPKDPVNALLSFTYALLTKTVTVTLLAVGFDPYMGFYHQPRYGRPSLALDIMEEFRPLVADSVVIGLINNREVTEEDFICRAGAVAMAPHARKKVIQVFERRLDTLITHPVFNYSISYRRVLEVQARLLARHLAGEISEYPVFCTR